VHDASEVRAEALFRAGTEKFDAGRVDEACEALDQSLRLDAKLGTLLNLGLCHEKQGKNATAWAEFSDAAAWAADAGQTERRDFAHQHAAALERALVRVQLRLPAHDAVVVEIDGDVVPESRRVLPLFLDPGRHVLKVTARSKRPFVAEIVATSAAGARPGSAAQVVNVPDLADEAAATLAVSNAIPPAPHSAPSAGRVVGLSLGAASAVGLGVGIFFGARSLSKLGDASTHCGPMGCDSEGLAALDEAKSAEAVSFVTLGASVLALGAGAWLWMSARPGGDSIARAWIAPFAGMRGGGLNALGTW
jgi:hypothetical protein